LPWITALATAKEAEMNTETNAGESQTGMKWWQWLLVYPTLAMSIMGSIPTIIELYNSIKIGTPYGQSSMATIQNEMWKKNLKCSAAPFDWYKNDSNVMVDGTICQSGDVLVRVEAPNKETNFWWVPVDGLINVSEHNFFVSNAMATSLDNNIYLAQSSNQAICQRFVADGRLLRRINTGQGCFDEIINTYTGQVLSRNPAPCNSSC
jgi:hypothetical protein